MAFECNILFSLSTQTKYDLVLNVEGGEVSPCCLPRDFDLKSTQADEV